MVGQLLGFNGAFTQTWRYGALKVISYTNRIIEILHTAIN